MQTRIERSTHDRACFLAVVACFLVTLAGCGDPSLRELQNRKELEALLTAVSLRNQTALANDIKRIEDRHASGELSDVGYDDLQQIIKKAQAGDWIGAEKQAYDLRESKPYFQ